MLKLTPADRVMEPLERLSVTASKGLTLRALDGEGREYFRAQVKPDREVGFRVGGALGTHTLLLEDADGCRCAVRHFRVDAETELHDEGGRFERLLQMAHDTMYNGWSSGYTKSVRILGKLYKYYKVWLRDHVQSLKGLRYFDHDLKSGIELYSDFQREDGMIWDNVKEQFHSDAQNWRDHTFGPGDFIRKVPGNPKRRFQRIPVENDVEWLFMEGLYLTWKATGDDAWMAGLLDNALRACEYSTSDRYRWSEKYRLLKRPYTIDTWDFISAYDQFGVGRSNVCDPDRTVFGVMHGDNTGFAVGCRRLAEMLRRVGREGDARRMEELADGIMERLDELAWTGGHYLHHVSEDPDFERDFGATDESEQVSLSNAWALNRRLPHEKCVSIIETYRRIRQEMPDSSPGEFYLMYPPFEKGFGRHGRWNYMNGGVSTITAGELARGAFEHGYERYGVDILDRVRGWGESHRGHLHCVLRGKMPELEGRTFHCLDLREPANCDFRGDVEGGVTGWAGDPRNDMRNVPTGRREFQKVEFEVIDPAENDRRACIGLSSKEGYADRAAVPVGRECRSIYMLHTMSGDLAGKVRLCYADGEERVQHVQNGKQVGSWFMPPPAGQLEDFHGKPYRVAWSGPNGEFQNVGVHVYGLDNPRPDAELSETRFEAAETGATWWVLAVTLGEEDTQLPVGDVSHGIPDMWGAGNVTYALMGGLVGAVAAGPAFRRARLSPRWHAAGVERASATVKYPASDGYVSYEYAEEDGRISLRFTGNGERTQVRLLLPDGAEPSAVRVDGEEADFETEEVEASRYAVLSLEGPAVHHVEVELSAET